MTSLALRCVFFGIGMACISNLLGLESFSKDFWLLLIGGACLWNSLPSAKDED
jgi:hypothetical protein